MAMLGKVFAAEIDGRLLQTKSKLAEKLERDGYIVKIERTIGDGRFAATVTGYRTTILGNAAYCLWG